MNYKELMSSIKGCSLNSFVIIYGEEAYLIDNAIKAVIQKYVDAGLKEMNYISFDKIEENFNSFIEAVTTFPFMADKKVIVVNECDFMTSTGSLNKSYEEKLIDMCNSSYNTSLVIFLMKNKKPDTRKKLIKLFKDKNAIYEIKRLDEGELSNYIANRFSAHQIKISPSNSNYIALNCGYLDYETVIDLYDVNNEADKLIAYAADNHEITREAIDLLLVKSLDSNIFKLVDFICENKKRDAFLMLEDMLQNGAAEQFIIHMIARQYRMIFQYQILIKKGYTVNEIMDTMKVKKFVVSKLSSIVKSLSIQKTQYTLDKLLDIDRRIKTGAIDKTIGLEIICNSF